MKIYYNTVYAGGMKFSKTPNTQQRDGNQIDYEEEFLPILT